MEPLSRENEPTMPCWIRVFASNVVHTARLQAGPPPVEGSAGKELPTPTAAPMVEAGYSHAVRLFPLPQCHPIVRVCYLPSPIGWGSVCWSRLAWLEHLLQVHRAFTLRTTQLVVLATSIGFHLSLHRLSVMGTVWCSVR